MCGYHVACSDHCRHRSCAGEEGWRPKPSGGAMWSSAPLVRRRRRAMVEKSQIKGKANKAAGSVKKAVGKTTKDRSLQVKGTAQKAKGAVQDTAGKVAGKAKGKR